MDKISKRRKVLARILVLEDDKLFNETLEDFLEEEGHVLHCALDPYSALDLTYEHVFDLYLFDVNLPYENGFELLEKLRQSGDETPCIFITSREDKASLKEGFEKGGDDYIHKPVDLDELRTTRKYGLGWLFISQTLASLPKSIVEQMRIMFFGFGLAYGKEFNALKEIAGGEENSLRLYQSFRDPHSAFDAKSKQYNFMSIGPVSPLSFSGTPLFFTAFNDPAEFLKINSFLKGE